MALVTDNNQDGDAEVSEEAATQARVPAKREAARGSAGGKPAPKAAPRAPLKGGFFTLYKSGQGYWTRMGTAIGAVLIALLTANFLYSTFYGMYSVHQTLVFWSSIGFLAVFLGVLWWVFNKPTNADFLIHTDGEMKKVNWTSRQELIGSTKVVIFFMFLTAIFLFLVDIAFGYFFHVIKVLKQPPF